MGEMLLKNVIKTEIDKKGMFDLKKDPERYQ